MLIKIGVFDWVIFVDRGAFENAGPDSGERVEPALHRPSLQKYLRRNYYRCEKD